MKPKAAAFIDGLINDPERREERKKHPWAEELSFYEHWGTIGGARNTRYMGFDELRREDIPGGLVYVCDNDVDGKNAVKDFSRCYRQPMQTVMFDERFPVGFDLADKLPDKIGCDLPDLIRPATWATKVVGTHTNGKPMYGLTEGCASEW
jgi:hypothetical protein